MLGIIRTVQRRGNANVNPPDGGWVRIRIDRFGLPEIVFRDPKTMALRSEGEVDLAPVVEIVVFALVQAVDDLSFDHPPNGHAEVSVAQQRPVGNLARGHQLGGGG